MRDADGEPAEYGRLAMAYAHVYCFIKYLPLRLLGSPEWSENWSVWPHCNGQAGCWMHYPPFGQPDNFVWFRIGNMPVMLDNPGWCKCRCLWCRLARLFRPGLLDEYGKRVR